ncbi:MAG: hypothetical protein ACFFE4_18700 [Candidatus Thorarchaeota archaeon]
MNEDFNENYDEYLRENKDFEENCDPVFEPREEIFDFNKTNVKKFQSRNELLKNNPSKTKEKLYITSKKLYNDGKRKECSRCHEIKSHSDFEFRRDNRR